MALGNEIALKREWSARVGVIITCSRRWAVLTMPNNSFKPTPLRGVPKFRRYASASGREWTLGGQGWDDLSRLGEGSFRPIPVCRIDHRVIQARRLYVIPRLFPRLAPQR